MIWTTTPWTIPSNKAVVYGDDIAYGFTRSPARLTNAGLNAGERYLLPTTGGECLRRRGWKRACGHVFADVTGENCRASLDPPVAGAEGGNGEWDDLRDFRAAPFVTDDEGTGFVHCAPVARDGGIRTLPRPGMLEQVITYNVMDDGRFRADLPFFGGQAILRKAEQGEREGDANAAVMTKLVEVGGLLARGKIKHSYPHSWRSKAPIIYPQHAAMVRRDR